MDVKVLFFARSRELAGTAEATVTVPQDCDSNQFLTRLLEQFPRLAEIQGSFVLSLNQEYLAPDEVAKLKAGDELAIIPPISGG